MDETRDEILALSENWSRAIVANDADAIGEFCANDWILMSEHGMLTRDTFLSLVRSGELAHEAMDTAGVVAFHDHGDTAVLAARVTSVAYSAGIDLSRTSGQVMFLFVRTASGNALSRT